MRRLASREWTHYWLMPIAAVIATLAVGGIAWASRDRGEGPEGIAASRPRPCSRPPCCGQLLPPLALPLDEFEALNQELLNRPDRQAGALQYALDDLYGCPFHGGTKAVPWELADAIRTYVLSRELQVLEPQIWGPRLAALDEADLCIPIILPGRGKE